MSSNKSMDAAKKSDESLRVDEISGASQPNLAGGDHQRKHKQTKAEAEAEALLAGFDTTKPQPAPPPLPPKKAEAMPAEDHKKHSQTARTIHNHNQTPIHTKPSRFTSSWLGRLAVRLRLNRIFTKSRLKYVGIGLVSFAVFALIFNAPVIIAQINYFLHPPKHQPSVSLPTPASTASVPQAEVVPPENVVIISKTNTNAPLVMEPSQQETNIQKSLQNGVVHYAGTAVPGEIGNVVIVGHSSNDWWEPGNYKFVFALLDKLAVGDKVQINYSSKKYVYEVTNTKIVVPSDLSVLNQTSEPTLTLITCTPPGTSWKRLIVSAKQVEPLPSTQTKPQLAASEDVKTASLPGSAPSFSNQIANFFSKIIAFFKPGQSNQPANPASNPTNNPAHLPEVS